MTGVAYAQRVFHLEREGFESKQGWTIKAMHSKETSPVQDEYAPTVLFQETLGHLASLDMMSGEVKPLPVHFHYIWIRVTKASARGRYICAHDISTLTCCLTCVIICPQRQKVCVCSLAT